MNERTPHRPAPVHYDDYREFLREMVDYLRSSTRGFSYRKFAQNAGYASSGFLKHVVEGERNLSDASIRKFADALGLTAREREDFELLVHLGQARTDTERNRYYRKLRTRRNAVEGRTSLSEEHYEAYSTWHAFPIREILRLPDFREDPEWIGRRLHPRVGAQEVTRALEVLERAGLIERDKNGRLVPSHKALEASPDVASLAVRNYHRGMLSLAETSLDGLPKDARNISSLTVRMNRKQYETVCERISRFQDEILDYLNGEPESPKGDELPDELEEEIYFLGYLTVPATRKDKKK